ncbi:hypothetical protein HLRTI_000193 [Halorhabdus tiamatea SARL4B]|uniref:Uncharacterized protein n=1 Tax=Halorhabdus tiamatea SARL4B TaxID=1033806 RepID=U2FI01_9EURY|nr:hypothetical protein HLRTI_000193 [Halorhabdus tiamatea SARL4B]
MFADKVTAEMHNSELKAIAGEDTIVIMMGPTIVRAN